MTQIDPAITTVDLILIFHLTQIDPAITTVDLILIPPLIQIDPAITTVDPILIPSLTQIDPAITTVDPISIPLLAQIDQMITTVDLTLMATKTQIIKVPAHSTDPVTTTEHIHPAQPIHKHQLILQFCQSKWSLAKMVVSPYHLAPNPQDLHLGRSVLL